jgi:hypothetical protein
MSENAISCHNGNGDASDHKDQYSQKDISQITIFHMYCSRFIGSIFFKKLLYFQQFPFGADLIKNYLCPF